MKINAIGCFTKNSYSASQSQQSQNQQETATCSLKNDTVSFGLSGKTIKELSEGLLELAHESKAIKLKLKELTDSRKLGDVLSEPCFNFKMKMPTVHKLIYMCTDGGRLAIIKAIDEANIAEKILLLKEDRTGKTVLDVLKIDCSDMVWKELSQITEKAGISISRNPKSSGNCPIR
jgi:hypothetical protein